LAQVGEKAGDGAAQVFNARSKRSTHSRSEIKRGGGSTYQVPVEVHQEPPGRIGHPLDRLPYARGRGEKTMTDRLAGELLDARIIAQRGLRRRKTRIAWLMPTKRLRIISGNG